jgi:hypothetical protein
MGRSGSSAGGAGSGSGRLIVSSSISVGRLVGETGTRYPGEHASNHRVRPRFRPEARGDDHAIDRIEEASAMPQRAWSAKRERQYEHIKEGLEERGRSEDVAEEIAARTVNKERARAGEARTASRTSVEDISSGRRGGLRSHRGPGGRTFDQLYQEARDRGIRGRSTMNKAQLQRALDRKG